MYVVNALHAKERQKKSLRLSAGKTVANVLRYLKNRERFRDENSTFREICNVRLSVCGETVWLKGLVDTGNCLYDGSCRRPVCVMDQAAIEKTFPVLMERIRQYLQGKERNEECNFHYLPYRSLGCPQGLALVFTAEYLVVQENKSERKTLHPRIAVADSSLLFGRSYQIILNPDVLQKGRNEHGRLCSQQRTGEGVLSGLYQNTDTENRGDMLYRGYGYSSGTTFRRGRGTDDSEIL